MWDVNSSCEIRGADDGVLKNPAANDMSVVLEAAPIKAVLLQGRRRRRFTENIVSRTGMPVIQLPSTSPANCGGNMRRSWMLTGKF